MLLLGGRKELQSIAAPLGGALIAAASASRGAMGFTGLGLVLTYIVSLLGRGSGRKAAVGVAGALALVALIPIAIGSIDRRLELGENPFQQGTEYDDREALNSAAMLILEEHPFGVGANHYVYSAYNDGYALRGGVLPLVLNLQTHVHNAYLLVGAEMGWPGLLAFLLLLGVPSGMAVWYGWRARKTLRGQLLLSFAISIMVLSLHSFYEWIIYSVETQYMLAMTIGMVAGLVQQIRSQPKAPS
jgi:O-antigen ligase